MLKIEGKAPLLFNMAAPRPQRGYATISSHLHPRRRFGRRGRARLVTFVFVLLLVVALILAPGIRISSKGKGPSKTEENADTAVQPQGAGIGVKEDVGGVKTKVEDEKGDDFDEEKRLPDNEKDDEEKDDEGDEKEVVETKKEQKDVGPPKADLVAGPRSVPAINVSAIVLFHNEYPTLEHTLKTWDENGLYDHVSEVLFFMNGMKDEGNFMDKMPILKEDRWKSIVNVIYSEQNLKLGVAITRMVEKTKYENVLLLEKDWALIENKEETEKELKNAIRILDTNTAQVVRFRHRDRPGAPLHARIMHEGREESMLRHQSNLFCYAHHWVKDPVAKYPQYFSKCTEKDEDKGTWCSKAKYCQWTNNPAMFKKGWFAKWLGAKYMKKYNELIKKDPHSHWLDLEYFTYWIPDVWNERDFVVALPRGLFEHQEVGEQNIMNTVWYAWNRLGTDIAEKRAELMVSEKNGCQKQEKSLASGRLMKDRYPIEFVKMYHYDRAMERSVDEAVEELEKESLKWQKQMDEGRANWRSGITALTNLWYKVVLYAWPEEPEEMKLTFVTGLFKTDGSGELGKWKVDRLCKNLNTLAEYRLVVYCTPQSKEAVQRLLKDEYEWEDKRIGEIEFVTRELDEMANAMMGVKNVEQVKRARATESWQKLLRERSNGIVPSISSLLLTMLKPYIVHDAAIRNKGGTHYVWFDSQSRCLDKVKRLGRRNDHILRGQLMLHGLITGMRIHASEVDPLLAGSGFDKKVLWQEMETNEAKVDKEGVVFADFKTLGGSRLAVSLMKGYYDFVLRDMLKKGEVGSGREVMSIAYRNVNYNFKLFESNSACRDGDNTCGGIDRIDAVYVDDEGEWGCKLFMWAGSCNS